jgi:hypothetical protein
MPAPTITLATVEDLCAISSQNLDAIKRLPYLYVPTDDPEVMRVWGIAGSTIAGGESSVVAAERNFPGTLVAPHYFGERPMRADLVDLGAEAATDFLPPP